MRQSSESVRKGLLTVATTLATDRLGGQLGRWRCPVSARLPPVRAFSRRGHDLPYSGICSCGVPRRSLCGYVAGTGPRSGAIAAGGCSCWLFSQNQIQTTLELSFDGGVAVTGTVMSLPNPAEFRTGTSNPQTGALRLEVNQTGNSNVSIVFAFRRGLRLNARDPAGENVIVTRTRVRAAPEGRPTSTLGPQGNTLQSEP